MSKLQQTIKDVTGNTDYKLYELDDKDKINSRIKKMIGSSKTDFKNTMELLARSDPIKYLTLKNEELERIEDKSVKMAEKMAGEFAHLGLPDEEAIHKAIAVTKGFRDAQIEAWENKFSIKNSALKSKLDSLVKTD